jgi:hypothetical protein
MAKTMRSLAAGAFSALVVALALVIPQSPAQANDHWGSGAFIIGHDYYHDNRAGEWLRRTHTSTCTASKTDIDSSATSMPYSWWNDIITSYDTYAFCAAKHFEHNNFNLPPFPSGVAFPGTGFQGGYVSFVGTIMDDHSSSIQWS